VAQFVAERGRSRGMDPQTAEREFFTHARPISLLKRCENPEEVANMIVYVCSARFWHPWRGPARGGRRGASPPVGPGRAEYPLTTLR
jgi:hypothetical protein